MDSPTSYQKPWSWDGHLEASQPLPQSPLAVMAAKEAQVGENRLSEPIEDWFCDGVMPPFSLQASSAAINVSPPSHQQRNSPQQIPPPSPCPLRRASSRPLQSINKPSQPSRFRLNARSTLLTFPRCNLPKQDALDRLLQSGRPNKPEWAIIAQETHGDGGLHLHILVRWKKKLDIRSSNGLDYITGSHGSYEGVKNMRRAIKYVYKEDPAPLVFGEAPTYLIQKDSCDDQSKKKAGKGDEVAKMLEEGKTIYEISRVHPGYTMMHYKKLMGYQAMIRTQKSIRLSSTHRIQIIVNPEATIQDQTIFEWAAANIFNRKRDFKAAQLYLHGPPSFNKTSFVRKLKEVAKSFMVLTNEDFDDTWSDDAYDFAVLDEFQKGQKRSPQWLNQFSDGQEMLLRQKGAQVYKTFNIPFIILSNFPPESIIDAPSLPAFLSRFLVVKLDERINLDMFSYKFYKLNEEDSIECECGDHIQYV